MSNLPDKMRVWIVAKDISVRARLREALNNLLFKPVLRGFSGPKELAEPSSPDEAPQVVIVTLSFGKETITKIAALVKGGAEKTGTKLVVAIDGRGNLESSAVVGLYLNGIDGFVSEPYSIRDIQLLFETLLDPAAAERQAANRTHHSAVFVIHDAMQYIDQISAQLALGEVPSSRAERELSAIGETLRALREQNPGEFEKAVVDAFSNLRAPKVTEVQHQRTLTKPRLYHPGRMIRELTIERNLDLAHLSRLMKITPEDLQQLLDEKISVSEAIAEGLARAFGRSPREWAGFQRDYDKQLAAQKRKKR